MAIDKILVPVDFSPCSDAALDYALAVADECGAEVEVLHVWSPRERKTPVPTGGRADEVDAEQGPTSEIFAETPEGVAMEQRLSEAEWKHAARVSGRLEFGEEPSSVILAILERESFDLVVMGSEGEGHRHDHREATADGETPPAHESGHVAASVAKTTACKVVTRPPPALSPDETEAA
jgi:nucleotide-binding universal stress UspA family protein